jgi:hypothetical protein
MSELIYVARIPKYLPELYSLSPRISIELFGGFVNALSMIPNMGEQRKVFGHLSNQQLVLLDEFFMGVIWDVRTFVDLALVQLLVLGLGGRRGHHGRERLRPLRFEDRVDNRVEVYFGLLHCENRVFLSQI